MPGKLSPNVRPLRRVTLVATRLPAGTPADAPLSLLTGLNGNDLEDPKVRFPTAPNRRRELTLELREGTWIEFKLAHGTRESVERRRDGSASSPRFHDVDGDTTVELTVDAWGDDPVLPPPPSTVAGHVETLAGVESPRLGNARDIDVYLPPSYATSGERYPVLYMHDGQNCFDAARASYGHEWQADEAAEALAGRGLETIIVAVHNNPDRNHEYLAFPAPINGQDARGERYAAFLVGTLKPLIDARYRTRPEAAATGVAGSSFGALIGLTTALSHRALSASSRGYPRCSGRPTGASSSGHGSGRYLRCASTSTLGGREASGGRGWSLAFVDSVRAVAEGLIEQGHDVRVVVDEDGRHNEEAWARRLPPVLAWFLEGARDA